MMPALNIYRLRVWLNCWPSFRDRSQWNHQRSLLLGFRSLGGNGESAVILGRYCYGTTRGEKCLRMFLDCLSAFLSLRIASSRARHWCNVPYTRAQLGVLTFGVFPLSTVQDETKNTPLFTYTKLGLFLILADNVSPSIENLLPGTLID
jgi:hypothetical protein